MGAGIAQVAAAHGCTVHLVDVSTDVLHRARAGIQAQVDRQVEKGRLTAAEREEQLARIRTCQHIAELPPVDLAMEAVVEDMSVKHRVFAELDRATPPEAILATNTSSLSVSRIAEPVRDPSRVVGMHFFNPAPLMPLVEVIAGAASGAAAVDAALACAAAWGKTPVRAKDTPGFIVNRVARGYYLEALRLLGEGVAGVDEVDSVMRTHGRFRMGPFELMDLVGLDVNFAVSHSVWQQLGRPARLEPHSIQQSLVAAGHLGRKAGRGFYQYDGELKVPAVPVDRRSYRLSPLFADICRAFTSAGGALDAGATEGYIFTRILAAIINEAGWALAEGVASASDIDTAMVLGTNYPLGPLAWWEKIGPRTVRGALKALNEMHADGRYAPAPRFADA
ncbi:MAG: 3-hydroxybutyryl-CoA dehydrogenase [Planctomycetes bacterium]|nr:3-hydroxybutyryl-CoA dehydrogenase [Planctomycetota bacterium]